MSHDTEPVWAQPPLRQAQGRLSTVRPGKAWFVKLVVSAVVAIALASVPPFTAFAQKPPAVKLTEELPPGPMQAKATTSCLECHEARIILQQRLSKAAWTREVDKMVMWGAVVDANDRDALIDYLSNSFGPDQPPYTPPRSAPEKISTEKKK